MNAIRKSFKLPAFIAMILIMVLISAMVVFASDITESTVDVTTPTGSVTLAPGGNGAITINLTVTGNQIGTATFQVYRDWTLSDGTFSGSNPEKFTVNPRAAQDPDTTFSTTGTVTVEDGQAAGTFYLTIGVFNITNTNTTGAKLDKQTSSSYQVKVETTTPPANTAPSVSVTGVTNGATYEFGSVPTAGCSVTDKEDVNPTATPTMSGITGPLAAYGLGEQTASCSYTDKGGLTASDSVTYNIVDTTDPVIKFVSRTAANDYGWNNGDVTVTWSCSDGSGSGVVNAEVKQTVSDEGANQEVTGTCEDHAGNTASDTQTGINIDLTAPSITLASRTEANTNGWNNSNVTLTWNCSDSLSGVVDATVSQTVSTEGKDQTATATCTDKAGNTLADTQKGINIDKTAPTLAPTVSPNPVTLNGAATAIANASDSLSGVASSSCATVDTGSIGYHSVSCTATDNAGNTANASATYSVIYRWDGFLQPINDTAHMQTCATICPISVFKGGSTVPVKFQLKDANGNVVQSVGTPTWLNPATVGTLNAAIDESLYNETPTSGNLYRWDATSQQYIYNWSTKVGVPAGFYYRIGVTLDDGQTHYVVIGLK